MNYDLRQGVTLTQHQVLDLIAQKAAEWSEKHDFDDRLKLGLSAARQANSQILFLEVRRRAAITAAALLIDAADEIGRLIGTGAA